LVAPEAAAAASSSVSTLMRTLAAERSLQVHSGGLTIEDIVREQLRPMLKAWLDANLPSLVEHLVRAEIERLVSRAVP
jgi:cell pole-organizing protein PopZ